MTGVSTLFLDETDIVLCSRGKILKSSALADILLPTRYSSKPELLLPVSHSCLENSYVWPLRYHKQCRPGFFQILKGHQVLSAQARLFHLSLPRSLLPQGRSSHSAWTSGRSAELPAPCPQLFPQRALVLGREGPSPTLVQ